MCNYNLESQKALNRFKGNLDALPQSVGSAAYDRLLQTVQRGQSRPGHDLFDGRSLPPAELHQGHYMSPPNYQRFLQQANRKPHRCQWCGENLPSHLVHRHQQPHDHREHIQHHFHPECWQARLIAIAVIFGHLQPHQLALPHRAHRSSPSYRPRMMIGETVEYMVKRVTRWVSMRPHAGRRNGR